jgi:hypothetical protein
MVELREHPRRTSEERSAASDGSDVEAAEARDEREQAEAQPAERKPPEEPSSDDAPEEPSSDDAKRPRLNTAIVGGCLAGVVLVAYFVWLSIEMGGHAVTGAAPMIAVFVAAGLGVGAAGIAFLVGRRQR